MNSGENVSSAQVRTPKGNKCRAGTDTKKTPVRYDKDIKKTSAHEYAV